MSTANLLAGIAHPPKAKPQSALQNLKDFLSGLFQRGKKNLSQEQVPSCRRCKSSDVVAYDSEELMKVKGKQVESWNMQKQLGRILVLTDGKYYCPSCKTYEMTFESGTLRWD
jgi:hypothetical protein